MNNTKLNLALFETKYGLITREPEEEQYCDYPRVSEYVEIDFPMIDEKDVVLRKVAMIDKQIDAIKSDAMSQVSTLQAKRQDLLALTASANA